MKQWNRRELTHHSPEWLAANWHGRIVLPIEMSAEQFATFWPLHMADMALTPEEKQQQPLVDRMYQQYSHLVLECELWLKGADEGAALQVKDLPLRKQKATPALRAALVAMIHPLILDALDLPKLPTPSTATASKTAPAKEQKAQPNESKSHPSKQEAQPNDPEGHSSEPKVRPSPGP